MLYCSPDFAERGVRQQATDPHGRSFYFDSSKQRCLSIFPKIYSLPTLLHIAITSINWYLHMTKTYFYLGMARMQLDYDLTLASQMGTSTPKKTNPDCNNHFEIFGLHSSVALVSLPITLKYGNVQSIEISTEHINLQKYFNYCCLVCICECPLC